MTDTTEGSVISDQGTGETGDGYAWQALQRHPEPQVTVPPGKARLPTRLRKQDIFNGKTGKQGKNVV